MYDHQNDGSFKGDQAVSEVCMRSLVRALARAAARADWLLGGNQKSPGVTALQTNGGHCNPIQSSHNKSGNAS